MRHAPLVAALAVIALLVPFARSDVTLAGNESSRLATVDALVESGTFAIDGSVFRTVDMVHVGNREYSDKPPLLSLFLALLYAALHGAFGLSLRDPATSGTTLRLLTLLGVAPFAAGVTALLARRLRELGFGGRISGVLAFLAIPSTWLFTYSVTVGNHVAAAFLLTALFLAMADRALTPKRCLGGGALAGILLHVEVVTGGVAAVVVLAALAMRTRRIACAVPFAATFLLCVGGLGALDRIAHGSVLPAYLLPYGYRTALGVVHASPAGLVRATDPAGYAWHVLLGNRGVFSYLPALLFAAVPAVFALRRGVPARRPSARRAVIPGGVLAAALVAAITAACILTTGDYGGWAYGCRYLVSMLPLLYLYSCVGARQLVRAAGTRRAAIPWAAALAIGVVTSAVGAWNPWPVCFEGAATEARVREGSREARLDARARNPFLANALCIAAERGSPATDRLARAALRSRGREDPVTRAYLARAFRNLGRASAGELAESVR